MERGRGTGDSSGRPEPLQVLQEHLFGPLGRAGPEYGGVSSELTCWSLASTNANFCLFARHHPRGFHKPRLHTSLQRAFIQPPKPRSGSSRPEVHYPRHPTGPGAEGGSSGGGVSGTGSPTASPAAGFLQRSHEGGAGGEVGDGRGSRTPRWWRDAMRGGSIPMGVE